LGHPAAIPSESQRTIPPDALFIVDGHTAAGTVADYEFETVRAVGFVPSAGDPAGALRNAGVARTFPRGTLAEELPRLLAEFAV
ncbi:MAG TPA: hypothetical protein VFK32_05230, partial [Tepidiformaceae bacterium]|nr:hypothetical protein [Tepidiformaceae bacterium]